MTAKIFATVLITHISCILYAGPWNKKQGHGFCQFSFTHLSYDRLLNGGGKKIVLKRRITDQTLQYYMEYGIRDDLNLILNIPFKITASSESLNEAKNDPSFADTLEAGKLNGLSNLEFGLRYKLIDKQIVVSAIAMFGNKMFQYQVPSGLRTGYDAYSFQPSLAVGRGWNKSYLQAETGIQFRSNGFSQNQIGNFEAGIKGKLIIWAIRIDYKLPMTKGHFNEENSVQTGLFRDNSAFVSPGLKLALKAGKHWFFNLAVYGAVYAVNEGSVAAIYSGLAFQW